MSGVDTASLSYFRRQFVVKQLILEYWARVECDNLYLIEDALEIMLAFTTAPICVEDFRFVQSLGRGNFSSAKVVKTNNPFLFKSFNGDSTSETYVLKSFRCDKLVKRNQTQRINKERSILVELIENNRRRKKTVSKDSSDAITLFETCPIHFFSQLYYAFSDNANLYFITDYYSGGELFFRLKKKRRFSENEAQHITAQIAIAIAHLHWIGYMWRNCKPENILMDSRGYIAITDFNLTHTAADGLTNTFCGTPEYIAVELIHNTEYGKEVDWWAFGILIYELCVGIPPFYNQNVGKMYKSIQNDTLKFPQFVSEAFKKLVTALLNRDPKKRLGYKNGFAEIVTQEWFKDIQWKELFEMELDLPYKPAEKKEDDWFCEGYQEFTFAAPVARKKDDTTPNLVQEHWPDFDFP